MVMGELAIQRKVAVIGSGPAGYVAAIRLGQLGVQTVLIEKERIGGVCTNRGCIPSKALIHFTEILKEFRKAGEMGIEAEIKKIDFEKTQVWKQRVVDKLVSGINFLLEKNNVEIVIGSAIFENSNRIKINDNDEVQAIEFNKGVIATGSIPIELKGISFDGKQVISSRHALELSSIPKSIIVVGGGYVGVEMAGLLAELGSKVTILEAGNRILSIVEEDLARIVEQNLREKNVVIETNTFVDTCTKLDKKVVVHCKKNNEKISFEAEKILIAVGRKPNTKGLMLENTKVELNEKGFIKVDDQMHTTDASLFAIGDVTGEPMLAHRAFRQGKVVAEVIAGKNPVFDNNAIPSAIFSHPEIAVVGLSEEEAIKEGYKIVVGKFPFSASGRALTTNKKKGFVKIIADSSNHTVLGVRIVGSQASNLIGEGVLAVESFLRLEDIAFSIHPHPTFTEALMEAAEDALGQCIHLYKKGSSNKN